MKIKSSFSKSREEIDDEYKIILLAKLNPDKFEILYNRYYKDIFAFIYTRTSNENLTADICSQVFLKAMLNIKAYQNKGVPFSAWLYRIAINEVNTFFRKTKRIRTINIDDAAIGSLADDIDLENREEKYDYILKQISSLPAKSMQLIELRFFEKRSYEEIAKILNISVSNAKVKVHRIISKLKKKAQNTAENFAFLVISFFA